MRLRLRTNRVKTLENESKVLEENVSALDIRLEYVEQYSWGNCD